MVHAGTRRKPARYSSLNGSNGFKIQGEAAGDFSGHSASAGGDVDDDGFGDLIIGAYFADPNGNGSGVSYVGFGQPPPQPELMIATSASVGEPDGGTVTLDLCVTLSAVSAQTVTVQFATINGSAVGSVTRGLGDFLTLSDQTLTFNPGETLKAITLMINGDTTDEGNENFTVMRSNPTNATIGAGTGTIVDNDAPPIDAHGMRLGKVKIGGDVTTLMAGGSASNLAVKSFQAFSLGAGQSAFQGPRRASA